MTRVPSRKFPLTPVLVLALIAGIGVEVTPRAALAGPSACIPPGGKAPCKTDNQCCEGAVCGGGLCKRGCKINKVYYDNGAINPLNECQWCQASTNRFGWTNRVSGTACGSPADTECTNPDTCNGAGSCLPNHEPVTTNCGDAGTQCTNQDKCNGSGSCTDNGFKPATTSCTGASQRDACDDDAADHCRGTDGSCVDVFLSNHTLWDEAVAKLARKEVNTRDGMSLKPAEDLRKLYAGIAEDPEAVPQAAPAPVACAVPNASSMKSPTLKLARSIATSRFFAAISSASRWIAA